MRKPVPQVEDDLERPGRMQRGEGSPQRAPSDPVAARRAGRPAAAPANADRPATRLASMARRPGAFSRTGAASAPHLRRIAAPRLMSIAAIYLGWAVATWVMFRRCRPAVAVLGSFLGGWILLPVGSYPAGSADAVFPYWIIGLALPSDMLLTKAVAAPAAALSRRPALRSTSADAPAARLARRASSPVVPVAGSRGGVRRRAASRAAARRSATSRQRGELPWLLGRLYFASAEGRLLLVKGLVLSALACLPFSLVEGALGPLVVRRGVRARIRFAPTAPPATSGFRPIGFFEHGNQFGLWISLSALAALWLRDLVARRALALGGGDPGGDGAGCAVGRRDRAAGARRGRPGSLRPGPAAPAGVGRGGADRDRRRRLPLRRDSLPGDRQGHRLGARDRQQHSRRRPRLIHLAHRPGPEAPGRCRAAGR